MKDSLGHEEKALRRSVSEVLHYIWDPIGVSGVVYARDEYNGYVDQVCAILWRQGDAAEVSAYLEWVAAECMGCIDTKERSDLAAEKLVEWRSAVTRKPV